MITLLMLGLLVAPVISGATSFGYNNLKKPTLSKTIVNYTQVNVNSSEFWDDLDTPNDITDMASVNFVDVTIGSQSLTPLINNTIVDGLHRHSELVASDGAPDPAVKVSSVGFVGIGSDITASELLEVKSGNIDSALMIRNGDVNTYDSRIKFQQSAGWQLEGMKYNENGNGGYDFGINYNRNAVAGDFYVSNDGAKNFIVKADGDVGIGTTDPTTKLQIEEADLGNNVNLITLSNPYQDTGTETSIRFGPSSAPDIRYASISGYEEGSNNVALKFTTGQGATITEKMRISAFGNVGIGTTEPDTKLHIENGSIKQDGTVVDFSFRGNQNSGTKGHLFQDSTSTLLTHNAKPASAGVQNSDAVSVGTAAIDLGRGTIHLKTAGAQADPITWGTGLYMDIDQNVGIGTTTPDSKLEVNGTGHFTEKVGIGTPPVTNSLLYLKGTESLPFELENTAVGGSVGMVYNTDDSIWTNTVGTTGHYTVRDVTTGTNVMILQSGSKSNSMSVNSANFIINSGLLDLNFRVGGDVNNALLYADAGTDQVSFRTLTRTNDVTINGSTDLTGDLTVTGNWTGNSYYAEGYGVDIGEIPMASAGVYYNVTNFTMGELNGATFNEDGGVSMNVGGLYHITGSWSFSGTASNEYHIGVAKNGVMQDKCHAERVIGTGGDVGSASVTCFVRVTNTDVLNAQIENVDSAGNPTIHNINFNMVRIGD